MHKYLGLLGILVLLSLLQPTLALGQSTGTQAASRPAGSSVESVRCPEDINLDGVVNMGDYSLLVGSFLRKPLITPRADINLDGEANILDYSLLVGKFLQSCLVVESPPTGVLTPDDAMVE